MQRIIVFFQKHRIATVLFICLSPLFILFLRDENYVASVRWPMYIGIAIFALGMLIGSIISLIRGSFKKKLTGLGISFIVSMLTGGIAAIVLVGYIYLINEFIGPQKEIHLEGRIVDSRTAQHTLKGKTTTHHYIYLQVDPDEKPIRIPCSQKEYSTLAQKMGSSYSVDLRRGSLGYLYRPSRFGFMPFIGRLLAVAIGLCVIALLVGLKLGKEVVEKEEGEKLRVIAEKMGVSVALEKVDAVHEALRALPFLFSQETLPENLLHGHVDETEVSIFVYRADEFKPIMTALFQSDKLNLPSFSLRFSSLFDKEDVSDESKFFYIDVSSSPNLSNRYWLRVQEEDEVRRIFNESVTEYFEVHDALGVEGGEKKLVVFLPEESVSLEAIPAFLTQAMKIFHLFADQG